MGWMPGPGPTNGDDVFVGTADDDDAEGLRGNDHLSGGDGADTLHDDAGGSDTLLGEDGNDSLFIQRGAFTPAGTSTIVMNGGAGSDQLTIHGTSDTSKTVSATLIGGDGDDRFYIMGGATNASVDGGAGNDRVILVGAGAVTVTLGSGVDVMQLSSLGDPIVGPYVITDFVTGAAGDLLDLASWFESQLQNWDRSNPFGAGGYARLLQDGGDTLLQVDYDGGANNFVTVLRMQNTSAAAFTAENTGGYAPSGAESPGLHLVGTADDDQLDGGDGDDQIEGLGGNDRLIGGAGDDQIDGGDGDDVIHGGVGADLIDGGAGADRISATGDAIIRGGDGDDVIAVGGDQSSAGHVIVHGDAGDDLLDILPSPAAYIVTAHGGAGEDRFNVSSLGAVTLDGGAHADVFVLNTLAGPTTLTLGDGADRVVLTAATSIAQPAVITDFDAGVGGDVIDMIAYLDAVLTTWDHQTNPFGAGLARLTEAGGATTLQLFHGGAWHDALVFEGVEAAFLLQENLSGLPSDGSTPHVVEIVGEQGPDRLIGGFGPEIMHGGGGLDDIEGGRGDDVIYGGDEGDELRGGDGDDIIIAGGGHAYFSDSDEAWGGAGADTFIFQRGDGRLTLHGFEPGIDHIVVYGYSSVTITHDQYTSLDFGDPFAVITLPFLATQISLADITFHPPPAIPAAPVISPPPGVNPGATINLSADLVIAAGQTYYANAMVFDHDGSPRFTVSNSGSIISITNGFDAASGIGGPSFTPVANITVVNEQSGVIRARADDAIARGLYVEDVVNHGVIEVVGRQAVGIEVNLGFVNSATGVVRVRGDINTFAASAGLTFDNAGLIEAISPHRAVAVTGAAESWVNSGTIRAYSEELSIGVWTAGGSTFINSGTIEADFAFYTPSGGAKTLENSGHILGDIQFLNGADHIGNTNEIVGDIFLAAGDDTVVNDGNINGDIYLGEDADGYAGGGGHLDGAIYASYGDDTITLGSDGNHVYGEEGNDHITGGAGDDVIDGGRGDDILAGGAGADTLSFTTSSMGLTVDLSQATIATPTGTDTVAGFENLIGTRFDDVLSGSSGGNEIRGGAGDDTLHGAGGADVLAGGAGEDTLAGGAGGDRFQFVRGDGDDVVTDFDPAQDHIEVWGFASYASLQQLGADVLIFLSPYNSILLQNTNVAALSAGNFTFHTDLPPAADPPAQAPMTGEETVYLYVDPYQVNAGEEIHFVGLNKAFVYLDEGKIRPVAGLTNDGSIRVTAHSGVLGAATNVVNNIGAEFIVELIGESPGSPRIAVGVGTHSAINHGLMEVRSSEDAWGVSDLSRFENHGVFRVSAEGQALGVEAWSNAVGFVNTGLFEVYGGGGGTTGYKVLVGGAVFDNSGTFRVTSAVSNSVAIDFGYNGGVQVFVNSGVIEAVYAIIGSGDGVTWGVADVQNTGEIYGIVQLGQGADRIVNDNRMSGPISLGVGDDQYLGAGGEQVGGVFGGAGNDVIRMGSNAGDLLAGEAGDDVLDGGGGAFDIARYSIESDAVTWHRNAEGVWTVHSGVEGLDTLTAVEILSFTDRDIHLQQAAQTFSGDGTSDILFRRDDGLIVGWDVSGSTLDSASIFAVVGAEWTALGTGDFDGDGKDDIAWRHDNGGVFTWHMNGASIASADAVTSLGAEWSLISIADIDGDRRDDMIWQNSEGLVFAWEMNGRSIDSAAALAVLGAEWSLAGHGDFNGDGQEDFLWRNDSGLSVVWQMNGASIETSYATSAQAGAEWSVVGIGDANCDGYDDLIWQRDDGLIVAWMMENGAVASSGILASVDPNEWSVVSMGDYNGDGRDDLLFQNTSGTVFAWMLDGASIESAGAVATVGDEWGFI